MTESNCICTVEGCGKRSRSASAKYCEMHYYRLRRNGRLQLLPRVVPPRLTAHTAGYQLLYAPHHSLAGGQPRVYEHRAVYHAHHGEGPFDCHWCAKRVTWADMHVDHLNAIVDDNRIDNLVASCPACNVKRGLDKMRRTCKQRGRLLSSRGMTMCLADWSRYLGISRAAIEARLKKGWSVHDALMPRLGRSGPRSKTRSSVGIIDFAAPGA
ncbi:HNH endonuclease [Caballeronia sp. S22]|uniref:HNH endonuclease n=1 Tax=Caballeronia sp. S22 TaxID=3137182 RepID=UPI0035312C7E